MDRDQTATERKGEIITSRERRPIHRCRRRRSHVTWQSRSRTLPLIRWRMVARSTSSSNAVRISSTVRSRSTRGSRMRAGMIASQWRLFWIYRPYTVTSPMLQMTSNPLVSRQVVFEQSDAGSTTTIELASKNALFPYFAHRAPASLGTTGPDSNIGGQGVPQSEITPHQKDPPP